MSAWTGTPKPSASVISRSFLITKFISLKIVGLGNGKMTLGAENLRTGSQKSHRGFGVVLERQTIRVLPVVMNVSTLVLRIFRNCALFSCAFLVFLAPRAEGGESYIAVEAFTGKILLELDADQRRPVASLTKIATAMVVLDWAKLSQTSMAEMAIVPQGALTLGGSNPMGLIPGDRISLREAMYSMLLGSDNVSALTLAEYAGRSIQSRSGGASPQAAFVTEMNNLCRVLGMNRTRFADPHGALSQESSTAREMARLAIYAMRDPGFQFYVKQTERTISSFRINEKRSFKVSNTHALVGKGNVNGINNGITAQAGACAATSDEKKPMVTKLPTGATQLMGRRLITITLGSPNPWGITQTLINQGWGAYDMWRQQGSPVKEARELLSVPVPK